MFSSESFCLMGCSCVACGMYIIDHCLLRISLFQQKVIWCYVIRNDHLFLICMSKGNSLFAVYTAHGFCKFQVTYMGLCIHMALWKSVQSMQYNYRKVDTLYSDSISNHPTHVHNYIPQATIQSFVCQSEVMLNKYVMFFGRCYKVGRWGITSRYNLLRF